MSAARTDGAAVDVERASLRERVRELRWLRDGQRADLLDAVIGWDLINWGPALPFWDRQTELHPLAGRRALEVGGGVNGGLALWMAVRGCHVVCSGLGEPSDATRRSHQQFGVADLIEYRRLDLLSLEERETFDVIAMKSVLGIIASPQDLDPARQALRRVWDALRPGGEVWVVENCSATSVHQWIRDRWSWGKGGRGWRYLAVDEVTGLLDGFASVVVTTRGVVGLGGRTERQRQALGMVDALLLEHLVSTRSRYVVVAIGRKGTRVDSS